MTNHNINIGPAQNMHQIKDESIELVVTSPPYPMIEMWDDIMAKQNKDIYKKFEEGDSYAVYELMHLELDKVWEEVYRVLKPGGIACVNIGDATRTLNKNFALYSSHSRIIQKFIQLGMDNLPNIIWRKQTNAPNKFMGSGMLPGGAYVTLEHEWVLIFRKGGKRDFTKADDKALRQQSAYFWEERNIWFSDLWDLKGTTQRINKSVGRERSAAYPFELPYRLINMYSVYGDTVLDPFLGTGTTMLAAIGTGRNSIGYEIDESFKELVFDNIFSKDVNTLNSVVVNRVANHKAFVDSRKNDPKKSEFKYFNENIGLEVMTKQELNIDFKYVESINLEKDIINVTYTSLKNKPVSILLNKDIVLKNDLQTSLF
ncbi:DNA-methyltransferase [Myroides phaeus]|uniref:DNA-methyltransferase n=1 Tax=Myroides phaeus TaxID=702745 RepID=UPI0013031731|nr:site-specific DNA-methyltransferase [Myroides phaeus]